MPAKRWYDNIKPIQLEFETMTASKRSYVYFDTQDREWAICFRGTVLEARYQSDRKARHDLGLMLSTPVRYVPDGKMLAANDRLDYE